MKKSILIIFSIVVALTFTSCDDFLDRPPLTTGTDDNYWTSETTVRLFVNGFYENYFTGYNTAWGTAYAPLRGYNFSDDYLSTGKQSSFETQAPSSRFSTSETPTMLTQYSGPSWNFAWVRKSNLLIERLATMKDEGKFTNDEQYLHWNAVGRFFRGFEYSRLVSVFGDVPYYDQVLEETDKDLLFKDRDDRTAIMDKVYDDFVYTLANMRLSDGGSSQYLNRYIAAAFISRLMLFEGTWQKYHLNNNEKAKKYLELAVVAGDLVIGSGKWTCSKRDFRSLFGELNDLTGHPEVLMARHYDNAQAVRHHVASYSNLTESQTPSANLDLAKSFICTDGQPYKLSSVASATDLSIAGLVASRDSRFEATFWDKVRIQAAGLLYSVKFIDRIGPTYAASGTYPSQYGSNTNTNDYPVMRYAEVVLNWIEAKAELETLGGVAVAQTDINKSINEVRHRPVAEAAMQKGVVQTADLVLSAIPDDPDRDADVSPLLWEIRRERRMEFFFEHTRLLDIKRWNKINYMDYSAYPDKMLGPWVDFPTEYPAWLVPDKQGGKLKVVKADGTVVTYDGTNAADMVGFYVPENASNRDAFTDRVYLAPVGLQQISQYKDKGYTLTQTPGW